MHLNLDTHPIPENVIYINDPCLADTCDYELQDQNEKAVEGKTVSKGDVLPDDNVRIYKL